jgi:ATP-grasp domain
MAIRPKLLIATWLPWPTSARLAAELAAAGADVAVVCPATNPIRQVNGLGECHPYELLAPGRSLIRAIDRSAPELVIAGDDIALGHLKSLWPDARPDIAALLERSFGPAQSLDVVASRARFSAAARSAGLDVPEGDEVASAADLEAWIGRFGAPAYLKADGTFGGEGVRLIREAAEAPAIFAALDRPPALLDAAMQAARTGVFSRASAWLARTKPALSVQAAIAGDPANCSVFAWGGEALGVASVVVTRTLRPNGVATVVRPVDSPAMRDAAVRIARALNLSGFFGLDFILEPSGRARVIELNARPTPISHFALGPCRDPVGALVSKLSGAEQHRAAAFPKGATVALFPHYLHRLDAVAGELVDRPLDQPAMVRAFARHGTAWGGCRHASAETVTSRGAGRTTVGRLSPTS